ncbi:MAG: hypothetical protein ABIX01_03430 [Chitinophagaceae bacterium]
MFKFLPVLCSILLTVACNSTNTVDVKTDSLVNTGINDLVLNSTFDVQQLKGLYAGSFEGTPISISINYVSGKNVSGYNVHKGLKRNMRGSLEPFGSQVKLELDEPGNNRFDGHFELFIDTASFAGKGTWKPKNDSTLKTKDFSFTKNKEEGYNQLVALWSDTLNRSIQLKSDGAAVFAYYTGKGTPQEQLQNFGGNWQQKGDSVIVFWQPNPIFPSRRSSFFVIKEKFDNDTTTYLRSLKGEKVEWLNEAP